MPFFVVCNIAMRGYVGACWTRVALNFKAPCSSHHVVSVWRKSPDSLCSAVGPLTWWSVGPCCSLWASSWPWCSTYCRCRETSPSFLLMSSAVSSPRPGGCRPAAARPQVCEDTQHAECKTSCLVLSLQPVQVCGISVQLCPDVSASRLPRPFLLRYVTSLL